MGGRWGSSTASPRLFALTCCNAALTVQTSQQGNITCSSTDVLCFLLEKTEKKRKTGWHFTLGPMNEKTPVHKRQGSQGRKRKAALAHPSHLQCVRENRRDSPAPSMPHHSEAPSSSQHKNASHERRGTGSWKNKSKQRAICCQIRARARIQLVNLRICTKAAQTNTKSASSETEGTREEILKRSTLV